MKSLMGIQVELIDDGLSQWRIGSQINSILVEDKFWSKAPWSDSLVDLDTSGQSLQLEISQHPSKVEGAC